MVASTCGISDFVRDFPMFPNQTASKSPIVQTLEGLVERLSAPDLTAAEAQDLRPRLLSLLESLETDHPRRNSATSDRKAARERSWCLVV